MCAVEANKKPNKRPGPKTMSLFLYTFADAYFNATGSDRTYKDAVLKTIRAHPDLNLKPDIAAQIGHNWAHYDVVQSYWKSLEDTYRSVRKSMHIRALEGLESIAHDTSIPAEQRVPVLESIADRTLPVFKSDDELSGVAKTGDEATQETLNQIVFSIKAIVGGGDNA